MGLLTKPGKVGAALGALTGLPAAVSKVRNAPKKHRPLIALRELGRLFLRFKFGPAAAAAEALVHAVKKL